MTEILEKNETKYNYFFWYHGHDSCYTDNSIPRVWYIIRHIDWEKSIVYILGIKYKELTQIVQENINKLVLCEVTTMANKCCTVRMYHFTM